MAREARLSVLPRSRLLFWILAGLGPSMAAFADEPSEETTRAWELYTARTEARIAQEVSATAPFSALDYAPPTTRAECRRLLAAGEVCVWKRQTLTEEGKEISIPGGLVHHWSGAILVPNVDLQQVLELVQAYDDSSNYFDEVEESLLLNQDGNVYAISLRLRRRKLITVHYNTEHRVTYARHGDGRASSTSIATHIGELADVGKPSEFEKPRAEDRSFLWALNSYWRFSETEGGTLVECESLSLSRSVPAAARWLVQDFLDSVPRESLESALTPLRDYFDR